MAVLLLLIGSFFLPNAVAGITDSRRLDSLVLIDSQSISFDSVPELGLSERIALVANLGTEILALRSGNNMGLDAAENRAARELARFFRNSLFELNFYELTIEEGAAAFIIDPADPALNMIVWELTMIDLSGNAVTVTIDDETGIILKLIYRQGRRVLHPDGGRPDGGSFSWTTEMPVLSNEELRYAAQSLVEMMTEYYGQSVVLGDYEFAGSVSYYRADLLSDGPAIPMYGVVRAMNFSMNER